MSMRDVEILRAACCVAGIDGEICAREGPLIKKLADKAGVGMASLTSMMETAEKEPAFFEEQFSYLKTDPERTIRVLLAVAIADGEVLADQRIILHHFAQKLGMEDERFDKLLAAAERELAGKKEAS